MEDNLTPEELVSIISNTDRRYTHLNKQYILIVKDEPFKPCQILVSDCQEAIWHKTVDINFFAILKQELHLTSPLRVFAAHFIQSLRNSSSLIKERSALSITIELGIGQGLIMSTVMRIQNRVHYNNPDEFKKNLKKFMIELWEVKHAQLSKQKQVHELQKLQTAQKAQQQEEEERKIKLGLAKKSKITKNIVNVKKGDLMNPERKRRKKKGAKFGTGHQQNMFVSAYTPGALH